MKKHLTRAAVAVMLAAFAGCDQAPTGAPISPGVEIDLASRAGSNVVNVTTEHLEFVMSSEEIGQGWTTFRYRNRSNSTHFFLIERLPVFEGEQVTLEDYLEDLAKPFQNFMDFLIGRSPTYPAAGFAFPDWTVDYIGGTGLTGPGQTSEVSVHLTPGLYVIECYVKSPDGTFHTVQGMAKDFTVGQKSNRAGPPARTSARLNLSVEYGIEMEGAIGRPGVHTFEVFFEDQMFYGNFVQHDVHLVRLAHDTDLDRVAAWMDWRDVDDPSFPDFGGLVSPAPATFLGGVQEGPAGSTAYLTVQLKKGDYAWIAELPAADLLAEGSGAPDWIVPFSVD